MNPKRFVLFIAMLACMLVAGAQDIIVKKDGSTIVAKVTEITDVEVKYKKADNPNGPVYTVKIADLSRINYDNGSRDVFDSGTVKTPATQNKVDTRMLTGQETDANDLALFRMYDTKNDVSKPAKKLKLIGIVGGGSLVVVGAVLAVIGNSMSDDKGDSNPAAIKYLGCGIVGLGLIGGSTLYIIGNNRQKQLDRMAVNAMSLYSQEIFSHKGKSLSLDVAMMSNRTNTRAFGLGMTYKF